MIHEVTKTALNTNKNYDELMDNIHEDDYNQLNGEPYNTLPNLPIVTALLQKHIAYQGQYWIFIQNIPAELYNLMDDLNLTPHEGYDDTYDKFETIYKGITEGHIPLYHKTPIDLNKIMIPLQ